MLKYTLHLSSSVAGMAKPQVPAVETGVTGTYRDGKPYAPCPTATRAALPYRYRAAFDRNRSWWFDKNDNAEAPHLILRSSRGKWLNTLYAIPHDA